MFISFITLTNTGYLEYTINCLKSLEKIEFYKKLKCYCIGQQGYNILKSMNYDCELIDEEQNSNFQLIREGNWSNIVYHKFKMIYENLLNNEYVCITDGDIVFENPLFMHYLLENIGDNDMLIQNDMMENNNTDVLCSGFMFIKSNPKTLLLFNPFNVEDKRNEVGWGDQLYINSIKDQLKYKLLPLELFPNGRYYYQNSKKIKPYLIHFNWVKGHDKKERMKEFKKLYFEFKF